MTRRDDAAYVRRERQRRADPQCDECHGEGAITITASGTGEREIACRCVEREPVEDDDAWSGGFAVNH